MIFGGSLLQSTTPINRFFAAGYVGATYQAYTSAPLNMASTVYGPAGWSQNLNAPSTGTFSFVTGMAVAYNQILLGTYNTVNSSLFASKDFGATWSNLATNNSTGENFGFKSNYAYGVGKILSNYFTYDTNTGVYSKPSIVTSTLSSFGFGNNEFMAINQQGNQVDTAPADTLTFSSVGGIPSSASVSGTSYNVLPVTNIAFSNSTFTIGVSLSFSSYTSGFYFSTDSGATWTYATMLFTPKTYTDSNGNTTVQTPAKIAAGNGVLIAIGKGGFSAVSSDDGQSWSATGLSSSTSVNYIDIAYGGKAFVVIDDSGNAYYTLDNGTTWTKESMGFPYLYIGYM